MTRDDIPGNSGEIDTVARLIVSETVDISGALTAGSVTTPGQLTVNFLKGTVELKTIASTGTAISPSTLITFITTDGDSDLDNATLADGVDGRIKIVVCTAEGNAADTWKITPTNMIGGTAISFAGVGQGCILAFSTAAAGWAVVANNGGTIA